MARSVMLIHGYSAQGKDFSAWRDVVSSDTYHVHIGDYVSLNNEISIKDIAEGLDLALRERLKDGEDFDAIVHSTGMLVVRSWLTVYPERGKRLKHLIALAPATNGSPLAHKGRGWLGAVFRGNRKVGPDFLEAGDKILRALELASDFTWRLAERDLFQDKPVYGPDSDTPYVFTFCGTKQYEGFRALVNELGTDGTVRWAGCALNSRRFTLDLTNPGVLHKAQLRKTTNYDDIPLILVPGVNHSTIVSEPPAALRELVLSALAVDTQARYVEWCEQARRMSDQVDEYQQFVLRLVDERGDPIDDYHVECSGVDEAGNVQPLKAFDQDVHVFANDTSLRNFHVKLDEATRAARKIRLSLTASSGTPLVHYFGFGDKPAAQMSMAGAEPTPMAATQVELTFDRTLQIDGQKADFFAPFTTTFVELKLNREPGLNRVFSFLADAAAAAVQPGGERSAAE
jgi:hypothetical protein